MKYPTIHNVESYKDYSLIVTFDNGVKKFMIVKNLLKLTYLLI